MGWWQSAEEPVSKRGARGLWLDSAHGEHGSLFVIVFLTVRLLTEIYNHSALAPFLDYFVSFCEKLFICSTLSWKDL